MLTSWASKSDPLVLSGLWRASASVAPTCARQAQIPTPQSLPVGSDRETFAGPLRYDPYQHQSSGREEQAKGRVHRRLQTHLGSSILPQVYAHSAVTIWT